MSSTGARASGKRTCLAAGHGQEARSPQLVGPAMLSQLACLDSSLVLFSVCGLRTLAGQGLRIPWEWKEAPE